KNNAGSLSANITDGRQDAYKIKEGVMRMVRTSLLIVALILAAPVVKAGDGIADKARATAAKLEKTAVSVRLVLKMKISMMGQTQDQEQKVELTGTVIDPTGLTVVDAFS